MRPSYQYVYSPRPRRALSFNREELLNIGLAVGALTLAFSIMWLEPFASDWRTRSGTELAMILSFSFVAVITGFLMHEIAHKVVAVRYGLWAEFRANFRGLMLAIFTALFGIVFAAPGAVMIAGPVNKEQNGRISVAGPLTNLGFGGGFFALFLGLWRFVPGVPNLLLQLFFQIVIVNLILGTFNMIPFPPLDGSKIWWWNKPVWAGMVVTFVALLAAVFIYF